MRNICTSQLWDIARAYFSLSSLDSLLCFRSCPVCSPPAGCVTQGQEVSCSLSKCHTHLGRWVGSCCLCMACRELVLPLGCCPWVAGLCHPAQEFMVSAVHRKTSGVSWSLHPYSASCALFRVLGYTCTSLICTSLWAARVRLVGEVGSFLDTRSCAEKNCHWCWAGGRGLRALGGSPLCPWGVGEGVTSPALGFVFHSHPSPCWSPLQLCSCCRSCTSPPSAVLTTNLWQAQLCLAAWGGRIQFAPGSVIPCGQFVFYKSRVCSLLKRF